MKYVFLLAGLLILSFTTAQAQLSVGYHQSNLPFVSLGYEFNGRLMPELRLATDIDVDENFSPELVLTYQFLNRQEYELYAGLGYRVNAFEGPLLPFGLNVFPFEKKNFGVHIELAPILEIEGTTIFRGSWGIRYRFAHE